MTPVLRKALLGFVLVSGVALIVWDFPRVPKWPTPLSDLEVTDAWLRCLDCQGPFLKRIVNTSGPTRDAVFRRLQEALLSGPSTTEVRKVNENLARAWQADSSHFSVPGASLTFHLGPGVAFDTSAANDANLFVSRYLRGFAVRWRGRAAIALGAIGTPQALAVLDSALIQLPRNDHIDSALLRTIRLASDSGSLALKHYP